MKLFSLRKTIVLLITMIAIAVPVCALSGAGTSASPYQVATLADLMEVAKNPDAYYKQTADIVINDPTLFEYKNGVIIAAKDNAEEWVPFDFGGNYNGNKKYITGLYVSSDNALGGFFKTLENATVTNLYFDFALVESDECAGILAAKAEGATSISGALVAGSLIGKTTKAMNTVGGIVGTVSKSSTITASVSYASVAGATSYSANVGGVAGINHGDITTSVFAGNCFGTATYYDASIGGIAGYNAGYIENCRNDGTVGGESTAIVNDCFVGGIAGMNKGDIESCENTAAISGKNYSSGDSICAVGGIAGTAIDAYIGYCTNSGAINGEYSYLGGIAGVAVSDSGAHYIEYCDNLANVTSSYGVAGGAVGRAVAAGEGYISTKLYIDECYNSGTLGGNAKGANYGEKATVESASVVIYDTSYSNGNTCSAGKSTKIIAETHQFGDKPVSSGTSGVGTARNVQTVESDKWIIRYTARTGFAPAPVLITLTTVKDATQVEVVKADVNGLKYSEGQLTGEVKVKVYLPEDRADAVVALGISSGNKYVTTKFVPVKLSDGRVHELTIPVSAVCNEGEITTNVIVFANKDDAEPISENVKVTK